MMGVYTPDLCKVFRTEGVNPYAAMNDDDAK